MRWVSNWMRRHRLLSLLGFGLVSAGVAWVRTRSGPPAPPPAPSPSPQPIADIDTPAMGISAQEIAAELARDPGSGSPNGVGVVPGSYPASAQPLPDGAMPSPEYTIKGKEGSMLCHGPSSPYYQRTKADVWFRNEQDAVAAGFRAWSRK